MKLLIPLLLILLTGCSTPAPTARVVAGPEIRITEINPNKWTGITRQNLEHLFQIYHLSPLLYTKDIQIQSRVIPHSHPVLTLNSRYAEQPKKLLSVLLHEQFHWWATMRKANFDKAILELKKHYPNLPQEGVAKDAYSTYLHLIVCSLEFEAMKFYVGPQEANQIINDFMNTDKIYIWIYGEVMARNKMFRELLTRYNLWPALLKPKPAKKPVQNPTKKPPLSSANKLKNL